MLHLRLMEHLCLLMMVPLIIKLQQPSAWRETLSSRPLQLSATPAYSGGPMIGTGVLYGLPQLMEQFGLRLPIAQAAMGPRPGKMEHEKMTGDAQNVEMSIFPSEQSVTRGNATHLNQVPKQICQKGAGSVTNVTTYTILLGPNVTDRTAVQSADKPLESQNSPAEEENNDQFQ